MTLGEPELRCKRRWLTLRLRTLMTCVFVISTTFALVAHQRRTIAERRRTVAEMGNIVSSAGQPDWHRRFFGDDPAYATEFNGNKSLDDERMKRIAEMPKLQKLTLWGVPSTDEAEPRVRVQSHYEWQFARDTGITDAGLRNLRGLKQLRRLHIFNVPITDVGLANLHGLTQLEDLFLGSTLITDAGLENLGNMPELKNVAVDATAITDAGLKHLAGLSRLVYVDARYTGVTESGAQQLPKTVRVMRTLSQAETERLQRFTRP